MFTSKERSNLRSLAQKETPITQIGKGGINDNLIASVSDALEARELIKLSVLENADGEVNEIASEIAEKTSAEVVCTIGRKIVLYRLSNKKGIKHIEYKA